MSYQQLAPGQTYPEDPVNENMASLGQAFLFAHNPPDDTDLIVGFSGGVFNGSTIADTTLTCADDDETYIVALRVGGTLSAAITTTNWDNVATYGRVARVTFVSGALTVFSDERFSVGGIFDHQIAASGVLIDDYGLYYTGETLEEVLQEVGASIADFAGSDYGTGGITALTGDVTASGPGSAAATIANDAVSNAKLANMATATIKGRTTAGTGDPEDLTAAQAAAILGSEVRPIQAIVIAASDETTALTTGTAKVTFRMPYAFTLSAVRASVTTAPTGGTLLTVDINEAGVSILSTKLTFDASEKTTTTAATAAVISDTALADDAEMTIDIDAVGSTIAGAGLKVYLIGTRT